MLAICFAVWFVLFVYISPVTRNTTWTVKSGTSVSALANDLYKHRLIASKLLFKLSVKYYGNKIQIGTYDIKSGAGIARLAFMFSHGRIATTTVVIPEGLTIKQVRELLRQHNELSGDVECADTEQPICNLTDGQIFPDTYTVPRGATRLAVLDLAYRKMVGIQESWYRAGRVTPYPLTNWNQVITLASIVQKETPKSSEMPVVASVYLNRLRKNMRLQADPTVVYALTEGYGDMRGEPLLRGHLKIESPYNTYRNAGLPPAPIANVGAAALRAVIKPANTDYLFFVADGRGGHRFSENYDDHIKNHASWRKIKEGRQ